MKPYYVFGFSYRKNSRNLSGITTISIRTDGGYVQGLLPTSGAGDAVARSIKQLLPDP